jgi:hypothetical protein
LADKQQTAVRGLADLKTAEQLAAKRQELEQLRFEHTKDWALNREFYRGNQWSWFSRYSGRVEALPTEDGDKPRWKVRLQSDEIKPGVMHYVAQLTKNRPVIEATPDSGSDKDIKAAQLATKLYEWWWQEFSLATKLQSALVHATLSQGFWKISWDPLAGKAMKFMVDPQTGQPITDEELADAFKESLEQQGVDPTEFEHVAYVGDIRVEVLPGENVLLDPSATQFEDAQFAIVVHNLDPSEVKARWPKAGDVSADSTPYDGGATTFGFDTQVREKPKTTKRVYIGYFRPTPALPKGRYVVWIEEPHMILVDSEWPFPFQELPLVKFPGMETPDSAYDLPIVTMARPIQKELNRTISQFVMHKDLTLKPQMVAQVGSLQQRLTTEPGAVFEYAGTVPPEWRQPPQLPGYVFEGLAYLQQRMDRIFNRLPSSRDALPARIDSGAPIDLIHEAVADQLSPVILRLEAALSRAGMLMVKLAQRFYIEPRLVKIAGPGGAVRTQKFMNSDIDGGYSFHAQTMSGLPRTRAGKQARIEFLLDRQLIEPRQALKHLDMADMNGVLARLAADEDHALREHDKILQGLPVNPTAVQEAMAAVQQGMNPQTGQPLQSEEEAQQVLFVASLMPHPFENLPVHADTHRGLFTSVEFESYPPEIQAAFMIHFQLTQQMMAQNAPQQPAEPPRVTLNLKGTTSAPVAGEILRKGGVEVSDEEVAMPPLETWVTDSIDKPDMDSAANDPLTEQEQLMAMRREEEKHALAMAKSSHEVALAAKHASAPDHSGNDEARKEEIHQERLRQMRQPKPAGNSNGG